MSRTRVGYDFLPVPQDIAPEWTRLPYQTRMLGISLWMLGRGEPIPVPRTGWVVFLCSKLEISGPDRPNIARALHRLEQLGLLRVCDGSATCLLRVCQVSAACLPGVCDVSAERKAAKSIESPSTEEKRVERRDGEETRAPERVELELKPPVSAATEPEAATPPSWANRGSRLIHDVTLVHWAPEPRKYRASLEALGRKPDSEWEIAGEVLRGEALKPRCAADILTPDHILTYWDSHYSRGLVPGQRQPLLKLAANSGNAYREL